MEAQWLRVMFKHRSRPTVDCDLAMLTETDKSSMCQQAKVGCVGSAVGNGSRGPL
jgi:hypothetical protein